MLPINECNRADTIKIGKHAISNSYCEKLLGVKIDSQLSFHNHLETVIEKKQSEDSCFCLNYVLYLHFKKKLLMNASVKAQFSYSLFVKTCHSRLIDKNIDRLHQGCLRFIYIDKKLSL